jgi:hypothetical protein
MPGPRSLSASDRVKLWRPNAPSWLTVIDEANQWRFSYERDLSDWHRNSVSPLSASERRLAPLRAEAAPTWVCSKMFMRWILIARKLKNHRCADSQNQ